MTNITCTSPAKINLFLHVTGRRPDGYHTLYTLMCRVKYGDGLEMRMGEKGLTVLCDHPEAPGGSNNSVYKAAALFYEHLGMDPEAWVRIEKKIPVGAGLGGGSSNAGTALRLLNTYYDSPLTQQELMALGLKVGADVPFFILEKNALAQGVGDVLKSVELSIPYKVLILYPGRHVSTAWVYKNLNFNLTNGEKKNNNPHFFKPEGDFSPEKHLWNDLEAVTVKMVPEIDRIKESLMAYGANGALMSGSGSSVFGLFSDEAKARHAYDRMTLAGKAAHEGWKVVLTEFMP
jgi:4-diphosphocytidyl-2-C-methyl-D-erythritol kinase